MLDVGSNTLRLELRTKNNVLWQAIHATQPSVAAFCRAHGFRIGVVGEFLNLKRCPWQRAKWHSPANSGQPTLYAARLCEATGISFAELFPAELYDGHFGRPIVIQADPRRLRSLEAARRLALPPTQDEALLVEERRDALREVLKMLPPRQEAAIVASFGLDGEEPKTLHEIGKGLGVTKERVRQIIAKGMRKLRNPARARRLRPFIDVEHQGLDEEHDFTPPEVRAAQARVRSYADGHAPAVPPGVVDDIVDAIGSTLEERRAMAALDSEQVTWSTKGWEPRGAAEELMDPPAKKAGG